MFIKLLNGKIKQNFKLKVIRQFVLLLLMCPFFLNSYAINSYSLFEPTDFIDTSKKDINKNKFNLNTATSKEIQDKIYNSFQFISDFVSETKGEKPINWIDSHKNPQKALELGTPIGIARPNITLNYPIYPLTKLHYFEGDSSTNSTINLCQSHWLQNEYQKAYNCFAVLQTNVQLEKYPATPLEKMQINLLQAFFMLDLLLHNKKDIKNVNLSTSPISLFRFKPSEVLSITKSIFNYIATHYDNKLFIPNKKSSDILKEFPEFYDNPHYLIKNKFEAEKQYSVTLENGTTNTLTWVRSVMPIVYANVIGFTNNTKLWEKGFIASEKFEEYVKHFEFPKQKEGFAIRVPDLPKIEQTLFFKPQNNNDFLTITDIYQSIAYQQSREPDTALKYISKGILRHGDPDLSSLLFKISGDAYFDLNILQLARRSYSWSDMFSPKFSFKIPSVLFFGAESAFWLGHYDVAKEAYKQFLIASGDKQYVPWARLRIGTIEHLQGQIPTAKSQYEKVIRNTVSHPAAQEAAVNLFCINLEKMTPKVKKLAYDKIAGKLKTARFELQKQAKTCLVRSDLDDATKESFKDTKRNVIQKAGIQSKIIQNYTKEFPENEFLVLFADRLKQLELSEASFIALQNKCTELIDYYEKNKVKLIMLSKENNKYVKGLKWGTIERLKLLRCSALQMNFKLWKEARKFDVGKDSNPLQTKFYELSTTPSANTALNLYKELKVNAQNWPSKLDQAENAQKDVIERVDFWELLAIHKFLSTELSLKNPQKKLLSKAIVNDILKTPKVIFQLPLFCTWVLQEFDKLSSNELDKLSQLNTTFNWVDKLTVTDPPEKISPCENALAQNLLSQSLKNPTKTRDNLIILPYLQKKGFKSGGEDWLTYAQRKEAEKGSKDSEVAEIYKNLAKETDNSLIKTTAILWLKKNFPDRADRLLW